jgi:hypothetical protein
MLDNFEALRLAIKYPNIPTKTILRELDLINSKNHGIPVKATIEQIKEIKFIMKELGLEFDNIQYDLGLDTKNINKLTKIDAENVINFYKKDCIFTYGN